MKLQFIRTYCTSRILEAFIQCNTCRIVEVWTYARSPGNHDINFHRDTNSGSMNALIPDDTLISRECHKFRRSLLATNMASSVSKALKNSTKSKLALAFALFFSPWSTKWPKLQFCFIERLHDHGTMAQNFSCSVNSVYCHHGYRYNLVVVTLVSKTDWPLPLQFSSICHPRHRLVPT